MKQYSYLCQDRNSFIQNLMKFKLKYLNEKKESSCLLTTIYFQKSMQSEISSYVNLVKRYLPETLVVGGTSLVSIADGILTTDNIVIIYTIFNDTEIKIISLEFNNATAREAGSRLLQQIYAQTNPAAVQLLVSGYDLYTVPFLEELSNAPSNVVFFGGTVNEGSSKETGCIFTGRKTLTHGAVAIIYCGYSLYVHEEHVSGWKALGNEMTITKTSGRFTVQEINGMPIQEIYKKYLNIQWDEYAIDDTIIFPFCFTRHNTTLLRVPRTIHKNGNIDYCADFSVGERVRLAYGDPLTILGEGRNMLLDVIRYQPEAIFCTSCLSRKILLQQDVEKDLDLIRKVCHTSGIYTFDQYIRSHGHIMSTNTMFSVVTMREGKPNADFKPVDYEDNPIMQTQTKIMSCMNHFIETICNELNDSNEKLYELAITDRLTGLLNHGEMEQVLEKTIEISRNNAEDMSLMMMDIDDFKYVNDNFGHEAGDIAIETVANIIKQCTESDDIAGRWGGDEFMVIFMVDNSEQAAAKAEKIRQTIEQYRFTKYPDLKISTSHGISQVKYTDTYTDIFNRADKALYAAKNELGKNAVVVI